jgi:hypothetical protein
MASSLPRGPADVLQTDVAVIGIKRPIDAALVAKAGECRRQLSATDCLTEYSPACATWIAAH